MITGSVLAVADATILARGATPIRLAASWVPISTSADASARAGEVPTGCRNVTVPPVYRWGRITPQMPLTNESVPVNAHRP